MNNISIGFPINEIIESLRATIKEEIAAAKKDQTEKLLSPAEACKLFIPAISKPTIIRWTADGKLTSYRIGGRVFYRQSEVIQAAQSLKKYLK